MRLRELAPLYSEASTQVFHEWVRVYYCRKYYQLARSRVSKGHSSLRITANLCFSHLIAWRSGIIPKCAYRCLYCDTEVASQARSDASIRKYINKKHVRNCEIHA